MSRGLGDVYKRQVFFQPNRRAEAVTPDISVLLDNLLIRFDVVPRIIDGRTLVPLRLFSEAFGCQVNWIAETRTIRIASPPRAMNVIGFYAIGAERASRWLDLFGAPYPDISKGNTDIVGDLALGWYTISR